ncbi:predicted protein [Verticillium alfalfae VaMs.102]|uniref:Predicted protein n=1 Tax=Verticillium alfalfae (strain VaMs.102 / ATCC MYA-4576 / FGSC 10136) TaxID=526221 RepID=C9SPG9_VERA1|nr:predicted protein [Verticillium alfalfae VaMs.102]EEY20684.1 predicted protein [Verticillium alfalfae VaMs.102]
MSQDHLQDFIGDWNTRTVDMEAAGRRVLVDLSKTTMAVEVILSCLQDGFSLEASTTPGITWLPASITDLNCTGLGPIIVRRLILIRPAKLDKWERASENSWSLP